VSGPGGARQVAAAAAWLVGAGLLTAMVVGARSAPWYAWTFMVLVDVVALLTAANALMGVLIRRWTTPRG
jgi:hypothetical protein